MKKLLTLLAILVVSSVSALAQLPEWEKPVPEFEPMADDGETEQYLYNIEAGGFFIGANDWKTRASISTTEGYKVKLSQVLDDEGVVTSWRISDYYEARGRWYDVFAENPQSIWIDNNYHPNINWVITALGDKTYEIYNPEAGPGKLGMAKKWQGSENTRLWLLDPTNEDLIDENGVYFAEGECTTWAFVSPEEYDALVPRMQTYQASLSLKAVLESEDAEQVAEAKAEALAVYNNASSTAAQLADAEAALRQAIIEAIANKATPDDPMDVTSAIVNPNFDGIKFDGWSGSGWGAGGTTGECAERYAMSFNTYQDISGLAKGVYKVLVNGFYRDSDTPVLYAQSGDNMSTAPFYSYYDFASDVMLDNTDRIEGDKYYPNSMRGFVAYEEAGYYTDMYVYVPVGDDGNLRIGVRLDKSFGNDWVIVDTWRLIYYGKVAGSYRVFLDDEHDKINGKMASWNAEGVKYTHAYDSAIEEVYEEGSVSEDAQLVIDCTNAISEHAAEIEASVPVYAEFEAKLAEAREFVESNPEMSGDKADLLRWYVAADAYEPTAACPRGNAEYILAGCQAYASQIREETKRLADLKSAALISGAGEGTDMTSLLVNPRFDGNFDGWTYKEGKLGDKNVECYEQVVDVYQIVEGVPDGIYMLTCQAFERPTHNDSWTGDEDPKVFLFMNNFQSPVQNIGKGGITYADAVSGVNCLLNADGIADGIWPNDYEHPTWGIVPNSVQGGRYAFESGRYVQKVYGLVTGGTMKIGLTSLGQNVHWVLWANFQLTYMGQNAEATAEVLQVKIDELVQRFEMSFDELTNPVRENVQVVIDEANAALESGDVEAMTEALAVVGQQFNVINATKEAVHNLWDAQDRMLVAVDEFRGTASQEALDAFYELDGIDWESLTLDELLETTARMKEVASMLRVPSNDGASFADPVDFTQVIVNPWLDNWLDGWSWGETQPAWNYELCEFWNQSKFDFYQEIHGMPAGIYDLSMSGFYRQGSAADDWSKFTNGTLELNAKLYANDNILDIKPISQEALSYAPDGYTECGDGKYVPNSMSSVYEAFQNGQYENVLRFEHPGGTLRIGIKKDEYIYNDWAIFDNFRLTFYGHGEITADEYAALIEKKSQELQEFIDNRNVSKPAYSDAWAAIDGGENAIESGDVDLMREAYNNLKNQMQMVENNIDAMNYFNYRRDRLNEQYNIYSSTTTPEAIAAYEEAMAVDRYALTTDELWDACVRMEAVEKLLRIPSGEGASLYTPVDFTQAIENPAFDNHIVGWTISWSSPYYNWDCRNIEYWGVEGLYIYQNFENLPAGIYDLKVQGFYRQGFQQEDYERYTSGNTADYALLYANDNTQPLVKASAEAIDTPRDNYVECIDGLGLYIPDNTNGAYDAFNEDKYWNTLRFEHEGGPLQIGVKKEQYIPGDLVELDNFQLLYYGYREVTDEDFARSIPTISSKRTSSGASVTIKYVQPGIKFYYSIDGGDAVEYTAPFTVDDNCDIEAWAVNANDVKSQVATLNVNLEYIIIDVKQQGTLAQLAYEQVESLEDIVKLRVSGNLSSYDLEQIRYNMPNLEALDMEGVKITNIYSWFMDNRESLKYVKLPATVTNIGNNAFYCCQSLSEVVLPDALTNIDHNAFYNCSNLATVQFKDKLRTIGNCAFYNTAISEFIAPASLVQIDDAAFDNCQNLSEVILNEGLARIESNAFAYCKSLESIELPSTVSYVGCEVFYQCSNLHTITSKTAYVPQADCSLYGNSTYARNATLYVPAIAVNSFKETYPWSQIGTILPIEGYEPDFIAVRGNMRLNDEAPVTNKPSMSLEVANGYENRWYNGHLWVDDTALSLNWFGMTADDNYCYYDDMNGWKYTANQCYSTLINNGTITADEVAVQDYLKSDYWTFMCLPFNVKISEITHMYDNTHWVVRRYNSQNRADGAGETWEDVPYEGTLAAGEGFIIHNRSNSGSDLFTFPAVDDDAKSRIFTSDDAFVALDEHASASASDRNWNLVGNPYPAFYDLRFCDFTTPITVWKGDHYETYSSVDDEYVLHPFEAFFVQRPDDVDGMLFSKEGRQANIDIRDIGYAPRREKAGAAGREVFNLTLSDGERSDRTRFVLNSAALCDYELERDAAKFFAADANVLSFYTIENGIEMAINERPAANGVVSLALRTAKAGLHTITLSTRSSREMVLVDKAAGTEVQFADGMTYTFDAAAGTTADRFEVRFAAEATGIDTLADEQGAAEYYTTDGIRLDTKPAVHGVYMLKQNGKVRKVVIK